ncbi:MAG: SDR family NAD(P)-dependent oxidoreductase [Sphingomonadaceae bacterium]|jgi:3-oxoacyl-[acyl-carrier protein] reductase
MKKIVVTGVSRGLGLALARALLAEGYGVVGLGRGDSPAFLALEAEFPGQIAYVQADMTELHALSDIARHISKVYGPIYGLVNNAGIGAAGVLATMHQADMEKVIATNLLGPMTLTKYLMRSMLARKEGRIVNISSISAQSGFHAMSVYAASKAGLEGFSRALSREAGKYNITVNCVAPGFLDTDMTEGFDADQLASIRRRAPLGLPTSEQVAGAVLYLLSPAAASVTGTVMTVDGGSTA